MAASESPAKGRIAEDGIDGLHLRNLLYGIRAHRHVEAGYELAVVYVEAGSPRNVHLLHGCGVRDAKSGQHLEEQVFGRAVLLEVVHKAQQTCLGLFTGFDVGVQEVGAVDAQHSEDNIRNGLWLFANLELTIRYIDLFGNLLACATDALFADVAEGGVLTARLLGYLHEDEPARVAVLGILADDSLRHGSGSRKEIKHEGIWIARDGKNTVHETHRLRRVKGGRAVEEAL